MRDEQRHDGNEELRHSDFCQDDVVNRVGDQKRGSPVSMHHCRACAVPGGMVGRGLTGTNVEGGHLAEIADQQSAVRHDWVIPGLAFNG